MDDQSASDAFLDSFVEQMRADQPGPGEYTIAMFLDEMKKRGVTTTRNAAVRLLSKWPTRMGRSLDGHQVRIYKAPE